MEGERKGWWRGCKWSWRGRDGGGDVDGWKRKGKNLGKNLGILWDEGRGPGLGKEVVMYKGGKIQGQ